MAMLMLNPGVIIKHVKGKQLERLREYAKKVARKAGEDISGQWSRERIEEVLTKYQDVKPEDTLQIEGEKGERRQAMIRGLVTLSDVKTSPRLSELAPFQGSAAENPMADNPPLKEDAIAAAAAIMSAASSSSAGNAVEKWALPKLYQWLSKGNSSLEAYARAGKLSALAGVTAGLGVTAAEAMALRWALANSPALAEQVEKGVIVGGAAAAVLKLIARFLPKLYEKIKLNSQTTQTVQTTQTTQPTQVVYVQDEYEGAPETLSGILTPGQVQRLRSRRLGGYLTAEAMQSSGVRLPIPVTGVRRVTPEYV